MQGLIVLSLCNTYSIPSFFLYAHSLRGRGIFRRFPTFPDLGKLKKVCVLADACGVAVGFGFHLTKNVYQFGTYFENAYIYTV